MSTLLYRAWIWKLKRMLLKSTFDFSLIFIWKTSWLSFDRFHDFLLEWATSTFFKRSPLFGKHQWRQFSQSNNAILQQSLYTYCAECDLFFTLSKYILLLVSPVTFIAKITHLNQWAMRIPPQMITFSCSKLVRLIQMSKVCDWVRTL